MGGLNAPAFSSSVRVGSGGATPSLSCFVRAGSAAPQVPVPTPALAPTSALAFGSSSSSSNSGRSSDSGKGGDIGTRASPSPHAPNTYSEYLVTYERSLVLYGLEALPLGDGFDLEDADLADEEEKSSTILQAAMSVIEDVRPDISSPSEILGRLSTFRKDLPDRYQAAFVSLSLPGLIEPLVLLDIIPARFFHPTDGPIGERLTLGTRDWYPALKGYSSSSAPHTDDADIQTNISLYLSQKDAADDTTLLSRVLCGAVCPWVASLVAVSLDPLSYSQCLKCSQLLAELLVDIRAPGLRSSIEEPAYSKVSEALLKAFSSHFQDTVFLEIRPPRPSHTSTSASHSAPPGMSNGSDSKGKGKGTDTPHSTITAKCASFLQILNNAGAKGTSILKDEKSFAIVTDSLLGLIEKNTVTSSSSGHPHLTSDPQPPYSGLGPGSVLGVWVALRQLQRATKALNNLHQFKGSLPPFPLCKCAWSVLLSALPSLSSLLLWEDQQVLSIVCAFCLAVLTLCSDR